LTFASTVCINTLQNGNLTNGLQTIVRHLAGVPRLRSLGRSSASRILWIVWRNDIVQTGVVNFVVAGIANFGTACPTVSKLSHTEQTGCCGSFFRSTKGNVPHGFKGNVPHGFDLIGSVSAEVLCHRGSSFMPEVQLRFCHSGKDQIKGRRGESRELTQTILCSD